MGYTEEGLTLYYRGKFNNDSTEEGGLRNSIEQLELLVGRLTLETNS